MHFARAGGGRLRSAPFLLYLFPCGGQASGKDDGEAAQMDDDKFYVPNRLEIKPGAFYFVAKCQNTKNTGH